MNVKIQIPDGVALDLATSGEELSHRALEAFALEEYRSGHLTKPALRKLLGFATCGELDGFLMAHGVVGDLPTLAEVEQEREDLRSLGF